MAAENLQTVIVSKTIAKTREKAKRLAQAHANSIYTSRETGQSWRFRQRPPSDFKAGSFRTFAVPGAPGVALIYGDLKRSKNPKGKKVLAGRQRHLQWEGEKHADINKEWDYWLLMQRKIVGAKDKNKLQVLALSIRRMKIKSSTIKDLLISAIADRAREIRILGSKPNLSNDERFFNHLVGDNPRRKDRVSIRNPCCINSPRPRKANRDARISQKKKKASKKKSSSKKAKVIRLGDPSVMPDPGPSAWCGSTLEFAVFPKGKKPKWAREDEKGNWLWGGGLKKEWLFLWSPKYKAVVAVKRPKRLKGGPGKFPGRGSVIRDGGGAKAFEIFTAREAEQTQNILMDECPLKKVGDAAHIVYRADKWSAKRKLTDYIHPFKKGVKLYCGPSIERPKVFLCFGGKLTMTERGLVF